MCVFIVHAQNIGNIGGVGGVIGHDYHIWFVNGLEPKSEH